MPPVVVDTNILFSALLGRSGRFTEVLPASGHRFFVGELVFVELFKHKEKIVRLSAMSESDLVELFYRLLRVVELFKEDLISPKNRRAAYTLCRDVDEADTPHVALTLELDGVLWTGDRALENGLRQKGFDRFFAF